MQRSPSPLIYTPHLKEKAPIKAERAIVGELLMTFKKKEWHKWIPYKHSNSVTHGRKLFTCVNKSWGEGKAKRLLPESVSITKPSLPSLSTDSPSSGPLPSTDVVSKECWDAVLFMEKKRIRLLPPPPGVTAPSSVLGTESLPKKKSDKA